MSITLTAPSPWQPLERVLGPDRACAIVDQILHETVGAKKGIGKARDLNVLFRIAMPTRKRGRAPAERRKLNDVLPPRCARLFDEIRFHGWQVPNRRSNQKNLLHPVQYWTNGFWFCVIHDHAFQAGGGFGCYVR